jgi:hypothetical protein
MKTSRVLVALCAAVIMGSSAMATVIFSANFDTGLNAQVSGGSLTPTVIPGGATNDVGITTGGLGEGGSGEALTVPNPQDKVVYDHPFGAWNGGAAYVPNGRISVSLNVNNLPTGYAVNVFDIAPSEIDPVYEPWSVIISRNANYAGVPTQVEMLTADLWDTGTTYQYFSADVAGNPLSINGWHTVSAEWYQVTPGDMKHDNIKVYVDGVLALDEQNVLMPNPYWMQELYIGAYHNASANSIGPYGYIDNVTIESIPEPATLALLGIGILAGLRGRK